ncbi:hypothetical protein D9M68_632050 [compost metagenome]
MVAVRSLSSSVEGFQLDCLIASLAAANAKTMKRSMRRASFELTKALASKPASGSTLMSGTVPAISTGKSPIRSIFRTPDLPASKRFQLFATPTPSGETAPIPVITIRFSIARIPLFRCLGSCGPSARARRW